MTELQPRRMRALLILALLLTMSAPAMGQSLEQARQQAREGNRAYEEGDYPAAIENYRQALESGLHHATIYYNLGNSHYKNGELGQAIHAYLRAQRLAPRDESVARNLTRARSQMEDQEISTHSTPMVLRPVTGVRDFLSLDEWTRLSLLFLAVSALIAVIGHWRRVDPVKRRRLLVGTLVLFALSSAMTSAQYYRQRVVEQAVVIEPEVQVRSGPGESYDLAFRIHAGLLVDVAQRRDDWVRIDLGGELVGWVPADRLRPL